MERGKGSSSGRGAKSKAPQHPQDIFALGSKATVVVARDAEKRSIHKPSSSGVDRKRDASAFGTTPGGKRSRIGSPAEAVSCSLEIDPVDLVPNVLHALDTHNSDKLLGLLTGSIRLLKSQRSKPDPILCMSILYLCKIRPNMFSHETVAQSLCGLLKREQGTAFKSKGNPLVFVLACNMLYAAHKENKSWPDTFIKVYIEDALNERWWVECSWCKCLVENIVTAFNTKIPPPHLIPTDNSMGTMSPSSSGSPLMGTSDDDTDVSELEYSVYPRYSTNFEMVEALVLEAIKDQIQRRAAPDAIGKGFLKLLCATCGFPEIRMIAASRLEGWLHSGKLWKAGQELLAYVAANAQAAARDHEVLAQLARMRLKTKPIVNTYLACLREMVSESPVILRSVVTHTIYNELSNVRSPNNMAVLASLMQAQPQLIPQAMAETYQELLMRQEEYLRPLRSLTRECVRAARGEAPLALLPLARALTAPPTHEPEPEIRERAFASIADLLCLCCLLTASHSKHLPEYKQQLCYIQAAAVEWLLNTAATVFRPSRHEYQQVVHKIMFLEPAEAYSKLDNWPPESERAATLRVCADIPLQQYTLLTIIYIGHTKDLPISPGEAFELIEQLVRRACALPPEENPLQVDKLEIADFIFQLCQYHHPDNISLPSGYTAPSLAITSLYWRGWLLLVMLAAHNPHSFATLAAAKYPTLRALLECCITNKQTAEWGVTGECDSEKAAILLLETHLATASNAKLPITEHTSRLLSQLTIMDPLGPARKPPSAVLEVLQHLNSTLRLGRLLCRQPALLVDIVERHGTRRAMPWLQELLTHDQLELSVLPVQCLCEFLSAGGAGGSGGGKAGSLAAHLRRTVRDSASGARAVLHYYMQRLAHPQPTARQLASRGMKLVLSQGPPEEINDIDWNAEVGPEEWLDLLWELDQWESVRVEVVARIRAACLVECTPKHLAAYLGFLAKYVLENDRDDVRDLVLDLSQVLMERMSMMAIMLPSETNTNPRAQNTLHHLTIIFYTFLQRARKVGGAEEEGGFSWCEASERADLTWPSGESCTLHILMAHAAIKLLCYGPSRYDTNNEMYSWMLSIWVGSGAPQMMNAVVDEESESPQETPLLPDWLRLHLVRSARPMLVECGLRGMTAPKLAVFIQTFGMPVKAMSALLNALDSCPAGSLMRLGVERAYMAQLLAVQTRRGATGGLDFAKTLRLEDIPAPPVDTLFDEQPLPDEDAGAWDSCSQDMLMVEQVAPLLATAFGNIPSFNGDMDAAFTKLNDNITEELKHSNRSDCPFMHTVILYLHGALTSAGSYQFAAGMLQRQGYSVPLIRTIRQATSGVVLGPRREICEILLKHYHLTKGGIVNILRDILECADSNQSHNVPVLPSNATKQQILAAFESATANTLERIGTYVIKTQDTRLVIDVITLILEKSQEGKYEIDVKTEPGTKLPPPHVFSLNGLGCGLLIDWMADLQPDILGPNPMAQMRLMFRPSGAVWRPQLVTLLAHRASWRTLYNCLKILLTSDQKWSASAVLEFAQTLARSPRVWQPRDKRRTTNDLLRLDYNQLGVLVGYMLEEARLAGEQSGDLSAVCRAVCSRLPLLLQCCDRPACLLRAARAALQHTQHADLLLLLLYMKVPKILRILSSSDSRPLCDPILPPSDLDNVASNATSLMDQLSHCLLTAMAASNYSVSDPAYKIKLDNGIRGLWARHWRASGRALSLCAALLKGVPARSPAAVCILGALEMVPPEEFASPCHTKDVECILESYMTTCVHGRDSGLQSRTAALIRTYCSVAPQLAQPFMQKHRELIACIPALSPGNPTRTPASSTPPPKAVAVLQQRHATTADLMWAVQELESWGSRRGGSWGGRREARALLRATAPLLTHSPTLAAHTLPLLTKLLPASSETTPGVQAIMHCLESEQPEFAAVVLEKLPTLLSGMPEHAATILRAVFALGMRSRHSVEGCISKCIAAINIHSGC